MPTERVSMRRVREILRCRAELGLGYKTIGQRVGLASSTVRDCVRRAEAAGLVWPLDAGLTDAVIEERLYGAAGTKIGHRRCAEPDWAAIHRQLQCKHVTLQVLWDEYAA